MTTTCLRDEKYDANAQGPCSAGMCKWPECSVPVKQPKNCYTCEHIENNGSNEPGEISGWVCANPKREPKTLEEERRFDENWASEAYRSRYKRCFTPMLVKQ